MRSVKLGTTDRELNDGDTVPLERKRALLRAVDETYFIVDIAAGDGVDEATITYPKNGDVIVRRIADAAAGTNTNFQRSVSTRKLWPGTIPRLNLWYTSPVGSTAAFSLRFVLRVFGAGAGMNSAVFVVDFTAPGPAVAGTEAFISVKGGGLFPTSPYGIAQFRLGRLGGDANANDLDILLAQFVMEEQA